MDCMSMFVCGYMSVCMCTACVRVCVWLHDVGVCECVHSLCMCVCACVCMYVCLFSPHVCACVCVYNVCM